MISGGNTLALRKRPDLEVRESRFRGRRCWVLKDPVSLEYVQLREEEYAILQMLDGTTNLESICERFDEQFAPKQLTATRLQAFLGHLHREGLLISDAAGQGEQLQLRHQRRKSRERWARLSNVLAIRFRGLDPEWLLSQIYPLVRWMFSATFLVASGMLAVGALMLVMVNFDELQSRMPDFYAFFHSSNLIWLMVALGCTKVLHEFGHALTCRHFGGECHEMGLLLLVFTPCLYCNVSDSWMLRSKWQRMAIAGAGIYVEVMLASLCTFLWYFSQPGLFNTICLNTMFICSVSTVLFNGNPLLRYDGYYVLSDLLEVPNLWQQSRSLLYGRLREWFTGLEPQGDRVGQRGQGALVLYAVASIAYRGLVLVTIVFFLMETLKPYRLELLAQMLILVAAGGMVAMPITQASRYLGNPSVRRSLDWGRLITRGLLLAVLSGVVLWIPLPFRVHAPLMLKSQGAQEVRVAAAGRLDWAVEEGQRVNFREPLAKLRDLNLERELRKLKSRLSQVKAELLQQQQMLIESPQAARQIPELVAKIRGLETQLRQKELQLGDLTLTAPAAGTVIAPPRTVEKPAEEDTLPTWTGTPLDTVNRGCHLQADTLFCLVGDPRQHEAILFIDQGDVEFVGEGQRVRLAMKCAPGEVLEGTIEELAKVDLEVVPDILAIGDLIPTRRDARGIPRPVETFYQARVTLDSYDVPLLMGARGKAKILAAPQCLAYRLYRFLNRTFTFKL